MKRLDLLTFLSGNNPIRPGYVRNVGCRKNRRCFWPLTCFLLTTAILLFPGNGGAGEAYAEGEIAFLPPDGVYIGGGYNYYVEHFKGKLGSVMHNTGGFSAEVGYHLSEYFSLEGRFQYYDEFRHRRDVSQPEWWYLVSNTDIPRSEYLETVTVSGYDITVNAKGYLPLGLVRPYGLIGLGWGRSELKVKEEEYAEVPTDYTGTDIWTGCMGRIGAGCDVYILAGLGLNVEVAYGAGMGNLDTLRYLSATGGLFYSF